MSDTKLIVTKDKLDKLATSISTKSGVATPMTIAQMKAAVDGIAGGTITQDEDGYIVFEESGSEGAAWKRPSEWPNYDLLNLAETKEESIYFTYDNRVKGERVGLYALTSDNSKYKVERVTILNSGDITIEESTEVNSNNAFSEYLPTTDIDYIVYRIIPGSTGHIISISMNSVIDGGANETCKEQPCIERYGYLPYCTNFHIGYAYRGWGCYSVVSDTLLGVPNIVEKYSLVDCYNLVNFPMSAFKTVKVSSFSNTKSIISDIDFSKINLTDITTFANYFNYSNIKKVDFSKTTLPTGTITSCVNMFNNCNQLEEVILPNVDYAADASTATMFANCSKLKIVDFPSSFKCTFGNTFQSSNSLIAIILRSDTVVPLSVTNNNGIPHSLFRRGGARIFVPQSIIEEYKTATNWSTLYASYPNMFGTIEGSRFE